MSRRIFSQILPLIALSGAFFPFFGGNIARASLPAIWPDSLACYQWQGNCNLNIINPSSTLQEGDIIRSISAIFNGNIDGGSCTSPAYLYLYIADQFNNIKATSSYVDVSTNCGSPQLETVSFPGVGVSVSSTDLLGLSWTYPDVGRRSVGSVYFFGSASANISFVFPTNATRTEDFNNWVVDYLADTTSTKYKVEIQYVSGTSTANIKKDSVIFSNTGSSTFRAYIPKSTILNLQGSSSTTWTAQAILYDDRDINIGSSPYIYFTVYNNLPDSDCDQSDGSFLGDVKNGVCRAMVWLFYPSDKVKNIPGDLKNSISNKPPFGWATGIFNAFNNTGSATTTRILSASTTQALSPFLSPVDNLLTTIIYLMGVYWTYKRFRHLEI